MDLRDGAHNLYHIIVAVSLQFLGFSVVFLYHQLEILSCSVTNSYAQ
jgi:hypothetical protein